ncbi:winged helix DNA-binding domain-containing protein [Amycolatopsis sp. CA-230715]|uniref:winged helix DNA-binding domain-containing protein n=1 Tax=Amycolatopsis sp. CA-230715 TaxID=2745196 RepID=UPI001C02BDE4|nr:winged helix DNA-binding domain-containing protein [Amycolatopsis sp. CA-230715]QWF78375.1 hypothetical protein HUW46_01770 [Amycolatopsis sp. CA-230715]
MTSSVLSSRALNRATLARQLLLRRSPMSALDAIRHLAGLQAQAPFPPYYALWARLSGFSPGDLSKLILDRSVVRTALMRGTVHLVTADDCLAWRPAVQPVLAQSLRAANQHTPEIAGLDLDDFAKTARKLLAERTHTSAELGKALAERWPGRAPSSLMFAARNLLPLVQVPPRGVWGKAGQPAYATAEDWLGREQGEPDFDGLVLRYLGAFGPASVADVQVWAGITRLGEVVDRLRPRLRVFRDEQGRELVDLPDAPRPDPDTPAPPRFLGAYDQLVLSYADRTRVLSDEHRKRLITKNAVIPGTVLAGGMIKGTWKTVKDGTRATLVVTPFERLSKRDTTALSSAGARLLKFAEPAAEDHDIRFETD